MSCPNCGAIFDDEPPTWVKVICFFFPIIGFWIFAFNVSTRPKYAKEVFCASLLVFVIILIIVVIIASMSITGSSGILSSSSGSSSYDYSTSSDKDYLSYCKKSGCYNKVSYSWKEYCDEHSYLE